MPYTRYSTQQKDFIRRHYSDYSNAELARLLGIDSAEKVRGLARKLRVKWRAENGAPRWRERRPAPA